MDRSDDHAGAAALHVILGALLREHRKQMGKTQADIAADLGYRNVNFVSMMEGGRSNIPLNRISEVVAAYGLEPEFISVVTRYVNPDCWRLACHIARVHPELGTIPESKFESAMDRLLDKKLKSLGLGKLARLLAAE